MDEVRCERCNTVLEPKPLLTSVYYECDCPEKKSEDTESDNYPDYYDYMRSFSGLF